MLVGIKRRIPVAETAVQRRSEHMQYQPGSLVMRIVSTMSEKQAGTVHFLSTIFKPVGNGSHIKPLYSVAGIIIDCLELGAGLFTE